MISAHGGGGSPAETLFFAVPLIVLGVALFAQRKTNPVVPLALVGIGLLFVLGAFTFLKPDHGEYGEMFHALCDARDADTVEEAETIFEDRVHGPLHEFADAVTQEDRVAAAYVLEAKQRVESDISNGDDPRPGLEELTAAVDDALPSVGEEGVTCDA